MLFLKTTVRNNVFCARFYCALLTTVVTLVYFMYILPEDGHRSGPKHVLYYSTTVVTLVYFMYILPEDGH
jgi:heme/copper-type cytochrome/quinol oxidase subunit 4